MPSTYLAREVGLRFECSGPRKRAGRGVEMVAQGNSPQLTPQPADNTPTLAGRGVTGGRRLGLIENGAVLILDGGPNRGDLGVVVPLQIRSRVPDGGGPVVLGDVGREPLQVLEVPGGMGQGYQPVTQLVGAESPDSAPQGEPRR